MGFSYPAQSQQDYAEAAYLYTMYPATSAALVNYAIWDVFYPGITLPTSPNDVTAAAGLVTNAQNWYNGNLSGGHPDAAITSLLADLVIYTPVTSPDGGATWTPVPAGTAGNEPADQEFITVVCQMGSFMLFGSGLVTLLGIIGAHKLLL